MKFLVLTLISNGPDPVTGRTPSPPSGVGAR